MRSPRRPRKTGVGCEHSACSLSIHGRHTLPRKLRVEQSLIACMSIQEGHGRWVCMRPLAEVLASAVSHAKAGRCGLALTPACSHDTVVNIEASFIELASLILARYA